MTVGTDRVTLTLRVNARAETVEVTAEDTLYDVLRHRLQLTSCRETCGVGLCGSCTVMLDGRAVSACITPAFNLDGAEVVTTEGIGQRRCPSALQRSFVEEQAFQCSFCTPGFLMSATAMLQDEHEPDVADALSGHLCRCGSYHEIYTAVQQVVDNRDEESPRGI